MRRLLIGAAALALAGPASAQQVFTPQMDDELVRAIPPAEEVEEMGDAMDRVAGALLEVPIGPLVDAIDAADPEGRRYRRAYPRERTLGDLASRDDPYFEDRLRDSIHRVTTDMAVTMDRIAAATPAMRRALGELEVSIDRAIRESERPRPRDKRYAR
jgi:hypothetical protein